ncbi:DUF6894 family protein [Bosea sp. RAF48]|uniref:DUF6894 family protein n=1 Tax=Bosea sp. RAF48 TaxID=3237480 RepID=UPI003F8DE72C
MRWRGARRRVSHSSGRHLCSQESPWISVLTQRALADMAKDKLPDGNRFDLRARVENEAGQEVYRASLKFKKESD